MSKKEFKPGNMLYPLPVVMVSCQRPGERPDIVTAAWCGTVCTDPPMVSVSLKPSRYSWGIVHETGEFVINLTTAKLTQAADFCGVRSGRDTDKFASVHLTAQPSRRITAPGIAESPVNIECRVRQEIPLGSHTMFLAEVVGVTVDEALLAPNGALRLERADLTVYSHGTYCHLGEAIGTFGFSVKRKRKESAPADGRRIPGKNTGHKDAAAKETEHRPSRRRKKQPGGHHG